MVRMNRLNDIVMRQQQKLDIQHELMLTKEKRLEVCLPKIANINDVYPSNIAKYNYNDYYINTDCSFCDSQ